MPDHPEMRDGFEVSNGSTLTFMNFPDADGPFIPVFTSEAARMAYPWLPGRVIAGSIWRGPAHLKVRVDEAGEAAPWPPPRP